MPRTIVSVAPRAAPAETPMMYGSASGEPAGGGRQTDRDRPARAPARGGQRQEDDQTNKDGKRPGPPWARDHVRRRVSAKKTSSRVTGLPSAPSTDAVSLAGGSTARIRPRAAMAPRPQT